ncbi:hypothetical protein J3459_016673 [Metarhizium acridum]|nr:hypothetical protein J3459_016673 [Metarhizium acridum]
MQFVLVPHAGAGKPSPEPAPVKSTPSPHAGIIQSGQASLLELSRGNSLVIQDLHGPKDSPENMNTSSYQVQYRWKIDETVGSKVFACHHSALPGDVVAKALDYTNKAAGGPSLYDCVRHWKEERDVLVGLDHPNIIKIKSYDGRLLVIYLEHLPLSLHRQTPVSPAVALAILVDILSALRYLEGKDVVHNDVKPANIAYSPERGGVLFDFGMATTNARKQARGGTSLFLPPEYLHVQNEKRRGAPGDIWALGLTMLFSIGKIKYPKKSERVANLANLAVRESDDFMRLEAWHAKIDLVRKLLSEQDDVEKVIYRMLDSNVTTRVKGRRDICCTRTTKEKFG